MDHSVNDEIGRELGRRVAERLRTDPSVLAMARANLVNWIRRNAGVPTLLRCYEEWRAILDRPIEDICRLLTDDSELGRHLRQNSPFAGVLPPREVWQVKQDIRRHATSST